MPKAGLVFEVKEPVGAPEYFPVLFVRFFLFPCPPISRNMLAR